MVYVHQGHEKANPFTHDLSKNPRTDVLGQRHTLRFWVRHEGLRAEKKARSNNGECQLWSHWPSGRKQTNNKYKLGEKICSSSLTTIVWKNKWATSIDVASSINRAQKCHPGDDHSQPGHPKIDQRKRDLHLFHYFTMANHCEFILIVHSRL